MRFCFQGDPEAVPKWNARCSLMGKEDAFCILSWNDWWTWISCDRGWRMSWIVIHFSSKISPSFQYVESMPGRNKQGPTLHFPPGFRYNRTTWLTSWLVWHKCTEVLSTTFTHSQLTKANIKNPVIFLQSFHSLFLPIDIPRELRN